eukprot:2544203-Pyramimonas_sp.AAC.1
MNGKLARAPQKDAATKGAPRATAKSFGQTHASQAESDTSASSKRNAAAPCARARGGPRVRHL